TRKVPCLVQTASVHQACRIPKGTLGMRLGLARASARSRLGRAGLLLLLLAVACQPGAPSPPAETAALGSSAGQPGSAAASAAAGQPPAPLQKLTVAILSTHWLQTIPWGAKDSG